MSNPLTGPSMAGAVDLSSLLNKNKPTPPDASSQDPAGGWVRKADDQSIGALIELSKSVPVIVEIYGGDSAPQLVKLIEGYQGRLVLGCVQAESAPEFLRALQVQGYPAVVALVGGQPIPLFQGIPQEAEMTPVLDQVLEVAKKNGVTGVVPSQEELPPVDADGEEPLPPLHQEAFDALSAGDIPAAKSAYERALKASPADAAAATGLAHVELLERLQGVSPEQARSAAANAPDSVAEAMTVADLDLSGGHVADACQRLLGLYGGAEEDERELLRRRLLSYFVLAGSSHDDVTRARKTLTSLMF
ncbi:MAG: putative thioredoxin [Pontimonas sp.]|jgi:putative thioredoxin